MHTVVYRYGWLKLAVVACAMVLLVGLPGPTSAHERNSLGGDKYDVVVGWLAEPAFVDEPNGVDFRITRRETREPVEGLDKTLKVEVSHGASKKTLDLRARHGQP